MSLAPKAKKIAIIGGMGPEAGANTVVRFLASCRMQLKRRELEISDQAYPAHLLVQYDVPDRTAALFHGGVDPLPALMQACEVARFAGASVLGIACNTAHLWHEPLAAHFPELEVLHIANESARVAGQKKMRSCVVLATLATHQQGLYDRALAQAGVEVVPQSHEDQRRVGAAILLVKSGRLEPAIAMLDPLVRQAACNADAIILGCTELGLAVDAQGHATTNVIDAAGVLADVLAERAYSPFD